MHEKFQLEFDCITATHGIIFHRDSRKIINHISPDVYRKICIPIINKIMSEPSLEDLLKHEYPEVKEEILKLKHIKNQESLRDL